MRATEHWPRADFLQTNDLRIGQLDGRLTLRRTLQQGEVGLFAAARWQQQARERFRKNGAPLPDPLITETIRSLWAGLLFASRRLEIRAALPLWVRTRNSSIPNTFRNRRGYRAGASLHLPLAQWLAMPLHLRAAYRIQQFAGEAQTTALWPKNRFQTLSLAVEGRW
ncbi:MAG: hypothetical protein D6682_04200 [Zetaproteobacteria bacterium]|nr:MAG: hypothetical protein D6682_04200 [Zetaproteobacteria bacterium]